MAKGYYQTSRLYFELNSDIIPFTVTSHLSHKRCIFVIIKSHDECFPHCSSSVNVLYQTIKDLRASTSSCMIQFTVPESLFVASSAFLTTAMANSFLCGCVLHYMEFIIDSLRNYCSQLGLAASFHRIADNLISAGDKMSVVRLAK